MKNLMRFFTVMVLMTLALPTLTSCDPDPEVKDTVYIDNKSTYTLYSFGVIFETSGGETITIEEKGTVKPGQKFSVDVPTGAGRYYMRTKIGSTYYFSVYYNISDRNQVLTDDIVGYWSSN